MRHQRRTAQAERFALERIGGDFDVIADAKKIARKMVSRVAINYEKADGTFSPSDAEHIENLLSATYCDALNALAEVHKRMWARAIKSTQPKKEIL